MLLLADNKNIIVVSGQNGFGKTTFLISLVWCLYGRQIEDIDDLYQQEIKRKGNYAKYIADSLNRNAKENGEAEFSVTAKFVDVKVQDIKCDVTIKRSYNTDEKEYNAEKIKIEISNSQQRLIEDLSTDKQKGEELFIRSIFFLLILQNFSSLM